MAHPREAAPPPWHSHLVAIHSFHRLQTSMRYAVVCCVGRTQMQLLSMETISRVLLQFPEMHNVLVTTIHTERGASTFFATHFALISCP